MVSIILRTIEGGQSIVLALTKTVALSRDENTHPPVMVWPSACYKGTTPFIILNEGAVDHAVYMEKVLLVALKYGNQVLVNDWIFQQNDAKLHSLYLTQ